MDFNRPEARPNYGRLQVDPLTLARWRTHRERCALEIEEEKVLEELYHERRRATDDPA